MATIDNAIIQGIAAVASRASLRDTASYGAGIRKFHVFCNIFSIREEARLPAAFELLHSFALWAATDPEMPEMNHLPKEIPFEPVAPSVVRKYLAAVHAWHIAQGWPPPLESAQLDRINWSLRGLDNLSVRRRHPP